MALNLEMKVLQFLNFFMALVYGKSTGEVRIFKICSE